MPNTTDKIFGIISQQGKRYCPCGNFGDKLTRFFLESSIIRDRMPSLKGYSVQNVKGRHMMIANMVGIGSVLHHIPDDFGGMIWTAGFGFSDNSKKFPKAKVIAVRGRETLKRIECVDKDKVIMGDGGLLCYLFAHPNPIKKYKLGVVPNYIDKMVPAVYEMIVNSGKPDAIKFIDVCNPCEQVISEIQECEYIISSSLHGLVTADALGIPNAWVEFSNRVGGAGFKFRDYYSVFDIEDAKPLDWNAKDRPQDIIDKIRNKGYARNNIDGVKASLLRSLQEITV